MTLAGEHLRRHVHGLRFRLVVLFAIGGFVLSSVFAIGTYSVAKSYLVSQRERSAERQAFLNARALRGALASSQGTSVADALATLEVPTGTSVVIRRAGAWYGTSVAIGRDDVPLALRRLVRRGGAGHERISTAQGPAIAVGLHIPTLDAEYFEIVVLQELASTLRVIRDTLVGAAALTTLAAALLGVWAARRVLSPLRDVSKTASAITQGELSERLVTRGDPDLDPLVASFNRMVDALQLRMERDARFASDVSHELRSPLTTLRASAEVLDARTADLPPRIREPVDLLGAEVRHFERLVSELLELARAEAGVDQLEFESVNLGELVLHAVGLADDGDFVVEIDPQLAAAPVLTDKRRVSRIVTNLVENACAHGRGLRKVSVAREDGIRIVVEDRGDAVPPAERERIFERFFRGAAAGRRDGSPGTGLGLALVAEHVRVLRGRVWVEDASPGPGARFVVEFPVGEP
jgi:two-component system, OmpR family, sensor histidine kinase MtrB